MEALKKWLAADRASPIKQSSLVAVAGDGEAPSCAACIELGNDGCKCSFQQLKLDSGDNHAVKACSSFSHSVINMVGMLIGLGQLSTPYALVSGGWASAFLLVGLGIACAYTTHVIGRCLQESLKSKDFPDIGEQAFGRTGRVLAATFIYLEIFMALVSYTISLHDNLATIFAGAHLDVRWHGMIMTTPQLLTVAALLVALPTRWLRDLSAISFLSETEGRGGGRGLSPPPDACNRVYHTKERGIPIFREMYNSLLNLKIPSGFHIPIFRDNSQPVIWERRSCNLHVIEKSYSLIDEIIPIFLGDFTTTMPVSAKKLLF